MQRPTFLFPLIINTYIYKYIYLLHPNINTLRNRYCRMLFRARMFITYNDIRLTIKMRSNTGLPWNSHKQQQTTLDSAKMAATWPVAATQYVMVYESNLHPTLRVNKGLSRPREKNFLRFRDPQPLCVGAFSHEIPCSNYMSSLCSWNLRLYC